MDKKGQLNFAQIDAKGSPIIMLGWESRGRTAEEETLRLDATLEYLQGVLELQERLREKYQLLFDKLDVSKKDIREVLQDAKNRWYHAHLDEWRKMDGLYYT